jgi:hypothetical protein
MIYQELVRDNLDFMDAKWLFGLYAAYNAVERRWRADRALRARRRRRGRPRPILMSFSLQTSLRDPLHMAASAALCHMESQWRSAGELADDRTVHADSGRIVSLAAPAFSQVGHPVKGSWSGYWGPTQAERNRILLVLDWQNNEITGTINPGPKAVEVAKADLDLSTWTLTIEADMPLESGVTERYVATGAENLGSWTNRRYSAPTLTAGRAARSVTRTIRNRRVSRMKARLVVSCIAALLATAPASAHLFARSSTQIVRSISRGPSQSRVEQPTYVLLYRWFAGRQARTRRLNGARTV